MRLRPTAQDFEESMWPVQVIGSAIAHPSALTRSAREIRTDLEAFSRGETSLSMGFVAVAAALVNLASPTATEEDVQVARAAVEALTYEVDPSVLQPLKALTTEGRTKPEAPEIRNAAEATRKALEGQWQDARRTDPGFAGTATPRRAGAPAPRVSGRGSLPTMSRARLFPQSTASRATPPAKP